MRMDASKRYTDLAESCAKENVAAIGRMSPDLICCERVERPLQGDVTIYLHMSETPK
jgi:hypothetical protein